MYGAVERIGKDSLLAFFKVISMHSSGRRDEKHEKLRIIGTSSMLYLQNNAELTCSVIRRPIYALCVVKTPTVSFGPSCTSGHRNFPVHNRV